MTQTGADSGIKTASKRRAKTEYPKQYQVILLNDDYTTMDFVVAVLETVFQKTPAEAVQIMLRVHNYGRGVCGVYAKQIAEAKAAQVHERAACEGFPLHCIIESI